MSAVYDRHAGYETHSLGEMKRIEVPHAVQCPRCRYLMLTKSVGADEVKVQCFSCGYKQKYQVMRKL